MKLPIPLQSVTMSAEQYEKICDNVSDSENFLANALNLVNRLGDAGVIFETNDNRNPFIDGFSDVRIVTLNDPMLERPTIKIILT